MQHLDNFEDIQFQNAVKDKLTLGGNDDKEKKKEKALRVSPLRIFKCTQPQRLPVPIMLSLDSLSSRAKPQPSSHPHTMQNHSPLGQAL